MLLVNCSNNKIDKQSIYNRIITDYYEQRIKKQGLIKQDNKFAESTLCTSNFNRSDIEINCIAFSNNDTYVFNVNDPFLNGSYDYYKYGRGYGCYSFNDIKTNLNIEGLRELEVWNKGKIYTLFEAIYGGIVSIDDFLSYSKQKYYGVGYTQNTMDEPIKYNRLYDDWDIEFNDSKNGFVTTINDLFYKNFVVKQFKDKSANDIHLYWSYGMTNYKYFLVLFVDGVGVMNTVDYDYFEADNYRFELSRMNSFKFYSPTMPYVYTQNSIYSMDYAFEHKIINIDDLKTIFSIHGDYQSYFI